MSMKKALIRTRKQLTRARNYNTQYVKQINAESRHRKTLIASLKRQRNYIAVEHRYINKMEKEALGLKKTSSHYKAIQNEIRQMRSQMKKEIRDVEAAYARALVNSVAKKNLLSKKRTRNNSRIRNLSNLIRKYNVKHKQFQRLITDVHRRAGIDAFTIKALNNLNSVTLEFQSHVREMTRKNILLNYRAGYSQCVNETNRMKRFYRRARCTK
jgi:uncharacterized protein YukE